MEESRSNTSQPDFSSLVGIMDRFYTVPFEQFQRELNDWFTQALTDKGIDPESAQFNHISKLSSLPDLVSKIYHQAELLKTISESKINMSDECG